MAPVEELSKVMVFPHHKARSRLTGEGGPLGVGRCSYSLYKEQHGSINFKSFVDGSVSSLLEHCLGWRRDTEEEEAAAAGVGGEERLAVSSSPLLSYLHNTARPCPHQVEALCQAQSVSHQPAQPSPLHVLLTSPHLQPSHHSLTQVVTVLLDHGLASPSPLESLGRLTELHQASWELAARLAQLVLSKSQCDVNSVNLQGRSLLSQSVTHLDESIDLTRILINHGARVWPDSSLSQPSSVAEIIQDKEQSAFTWFLRALINQRGLDHSSQTLECLCHEMGREPERMKSHVQRVMLSEGRFPRVLGPVFLQLKVAMTPFWSQPQHLKYLAWQGVRRSIGPKRLGRGGAGNLCLPTPLIQYITLTRPTNTRHRLKIKDF